MDDVFFVHNFAPSFDIFGYEMRYYGVLFAASFLIGYFMMRRMFIRLGYKEEAAQTFYFLGLVITVIGARLVHVFFYDMDAFQADPSMIYKIWQGGVASHGGIGGLILAGWIFSRWKNMPYLDLLDCLAQSFALTAILVRLGNFMNGEIVGRVTEVPWAMVFKHYDNLPRHPSQLYEAAYGLVILITLLWLDVWRERKKKEDPSMRWTGLLFFVGAIMYPSFRFLAEYLKEYQTLSPSFPLTMGQILSIPFILVGVFGVFWVWRNRREGLDPVKVPSPARKRPGQARAAAASAAAAEEAPRSSRTAPVKANAADKAEPADKADAPVADTPAPDAEDEPADAETEDTAQQTDEPARPSASSDTSSPSKPAASSKKPRSKKSRKGGR